MLPFILCVESGCTNAVVTIIVFLVGYFLGRHRNEVKVEADLMAAFPGLARRRRQRLILTCVLGSIFAVGMLTVVPKGYGERIRRRRLGLANFSDPKSVAPRVDDAAYRAATDATGEAPAREVHVKSMCRCPGGYFPVPGRASAEGIDTGITQPPFGSARHPKRFIMHPPAEGTGCECKHEKWSKATPDTFLNVLQRRCPNPKYTGNYNWEVMPDLGVEEKLPIFVGILSFQSPLSLNNSLRNWRREGLFRRIDAKGVFVQLNHRSQRDDEVLDEYQSFLEPNEHVPLTAMGSPEENINPGLAISKFCRAAEAHPDGHPDGENLLLFLEKDWVLREAAVAYRVAHLEQVFGSVSTLMQRGVSVVRLKQLSHEVAQNDAKKWSCRADGIPWVCVTAHQHRWSNQPSVISCKWFLRYLEPFALLQDPIMSGCRDTFQDIGYVDFEEAMQDGRVAWTNSQWVMAGINPAPPSPRMFIHREIDG